MYIRIRVADGSLMQTHVDGSDLLEYRKNSFCVPSLRNAAESISCIESVFQPDEMASVTAVYQILYPNVIFETVPMVHERFHVLEVFNEVLSSAESKGNCSTAVCANWAGVGGNLAANIFVSVLYSTLFDMLYDSHHLLYPKRSHISSLVFIGLLPILMKIGFLIVASFYHQRLLRMDLLLSFLLAEYVAVVLLQKRRLFFTMERKRLL